MKLVCISDTHNQTFDLPPGDVLIHAGDLCGFGDIKEVAKGLDWLASFQHQYKLIVFCPGNHDQFFEEDPAGAAIMCEERGILWYWDDGFEFEGYKFWSSPYQIEFHNWAFNKTIEELADHWNKIPDGTDILITHSPPYGIMDYTTMSHTHIGCRSLLARVWDVKPLVHVFGHAHGWGGIKEENGTKFVNASQLDEMYVRNKHPVIIDLPDRVGSDIDILLEQT